MAPSPPLADVCSTAWIGAERQPTSATAFTIVRGGRDRAVDLRRRDVMLAVVQAVRTGPAEHGRQAARSAGFGSAAGDLRAGPRGSRAAEAARLDPIEENSATHCAVPPV